jgi:hypothetical protein
MNEIVSSSTLASRGVTAVGGIAGGIGLMVVGALWWPLAIIVGGVVGIAGLGAMSSHEAADKKLGMAAAGIGALTILSRLPLLGGLAGSVLGLASIALLALGGWNAWKFFQGLKSRS